MTCSNHSIPQEDQDLFLSFQGNCTSPAEETFFKTIRQKEENELTALNELLVSEYDNPDEIYIVREYYEEYVIGQGIGSNGAKEVHVMTLAEALAVNMKEAGLLERDITLLDWLRESDYRYVLYDRNWDLNR